MGLTNLLSRGVKGARKIVESSADAFTKGADVVADSAAFLSGAAAKEFSRKVGLSFLTRSGDFLTDFLGTSAADTITAAAVGLAENIVEHNQKASGLVKYSLTGFGKTAFIGAGIISTGLEIANYNREANSGQIVKGMQAPQLYYDYQDLKPTFNDDNTGASGDLVFALNNLR